MPGERACGPVADISISRKGKRGQARLMGISAFVCLTLKKASKREILFDDS
jgi:hypothetical protein